MLEQIIKQHILDHGPVTFEQFMTTALYHPQYGYYNAPTIKIGRQGDYYTAPTATSVFGAMLVRQFYQMWQLAGRPVPWVLVEYGPGTGQLAHDVVTKAAQDYPDFYAALMYYLVEISPSLQQRQQQLLFSTYVGDKFNWIDNLEQIKNKQFHCVYANELVDAFPVHLVQQGHDALQELYVDCRDGLLCWQTGPLSDLHLADYFKMQNVKLELGQRAEVNRQAYQWLHHVATHLQKGFVLIIDYGLKAQAMYQPARFNGTLRCFHQHRLVDDPLINVGSQDITAHVNFTVMDIWARQCGLHKLGLVTQPDFLINLGLLNTLQQHQDYDLSPLALQKINAIKQLVLPGGMGGLFKVMVLAKGWSVQPDLIGLTGLK